MEKEGTAEYRRTQIAKYKLCGIDFKALDDSCTQVRLEGLHNNLKMLKIPDGVEEISSKLAYLKRNNLKLKVTPEIKEVGLPDSLKIIGEDAFYEYSSLESVTIPDTVTEIGKFAFLNCFNLKRVEIHKQEKNSTGLQRIDDSAFLDCKSLLEIELEDTITYIGASAFNSSGLKGTLKLPKSLKELRVGAFSNTDIEVVDFNNCVGLNTIEIMVFNNCTKLKLDKNVPKHLTKRVKRMLKGE